MNVPFTRTPTGIVGKWQFYAEPTIWVEGPTDIYFYLPIVDDLPCRLEAFHGAENAHALTKGLIDRDLPYVVVLDGDYTVLSRTRSPHRRIIRLRRYSFENYLWERDAFNRCCLRHAQSGDRDDVCYTEFDRITAHIHDILFESVVLDVAARNSDPSPKVLPDRVERLLARSDRPDIDPQKVESMSSHARSKLDINKIENARQLVGVYVTKRRLADLLRGHLLFGILRTLFTSLATKIRGTKVVLNDDALTQLLSSTIWVRATSNDHRTLKLALRRQVRECSFHFSSAK